MSVVPNELVGYGSANMPESDGVTIGGAVDTTKRVSFYDMVTTGTVDVVSSSASDIAVKIQVAGRDGSGVIQTPAAVTVTGTTLLSATFGGQQFQRLLYGVITSGAIGPLVNPGGSLAAGDIACMATTKTVSGHAFSAAATSTSGTTPPLAHLQAGDGATLGALTNGGVGTILRVTSGSGNNQLRYVAAPYSSGTYGADIVVVNRDWGTAPASGDTYNIAPGMLFDISPNPVRAITRCFATAGADVPGGTQRIYYEKVFMVNNDTTTALTSGAIQIASDIPGLPGSSALDIALCTALNDTNTAANRQTAPASGAGAFVVQPSAVSVPGSGNLTAGAAPNVSGAQGVWLRLTLPAGTSVYQGGSDLRTTGNTT